MMNLLEQKKESENPKPTETRPERKEMTETSDEEMNEAYAVLDLPKDLLMSIINKIFSIPDLFAFAAATRSSQTLVAENLSKYCSFPPLLLQPGYRRLRTVTDKSRFYMSRLPEKTVGLRCLGCYHGHLITLDRRRLVLTSVFTGKEIVSNEIEFDIRKSRYIENHYVKNFSLLTAPPTSAACVFLWLIGGGKIVHWRPAIEDSEVIISHIWPAIYGDMTSMAVLKGKVYCIDRRFPTRLVEFDPHSNAHWEAKIRTADNNRFPLHSSDDHTDDEFYLFGCGEELLLVQCICGDHCVLSTIKLYRFDFSKSLWVEAQGLRDWCLFIDFASGCPVACYNPRRWGGRDNCAYIAGPGCSTWIVVPLDRSVLVDCIGKINMCASSSSWPSPIWVYPNVPFLT